jgi:phosphinothricin acetyltransferase
MMAVVRDATPADLPAILALHNHHILYSLAIWRSEPADLNERQAWFEDRRRKDQPVLVAELGGLFAGFASYGDFRTGSGYAGTVENSVYVRPDFHGKGVARGLMAALIGRARQSGRHTMVAGIGLPNPVSVALHVSLGFVEAGRLRGIGRKHGQALDLLLMQLDLEPPASAGRPTA